jgi:glycosyltransferase involved in cell wall biosynthesis
MKISIITVSYNSQETIKATIDSVLNQSYDNIEYIIIDGKSKDGTMDIIHCYNDERILYVSEPDKGIYDAINKGIRMATGVIVGILNSDDTYHDDNVVKRIVDSFTGQQVEAVFADVIYTDRYSGKKKRYYSSGYFKPFLFRFGFMPAHPSFYTYRHNFEKFGLYAIGYKIAADFDLLLRFIGTHAMPCRYVKDVWVNMKEGGVSNASICSLFLLNREIIQSCRENGIYTNILIVYLKYFVKWVGFIRKR